MGKYFFDSYALVELIKINPSYIKYSEEIITITLFNLIELYYAVLRDFNETKAKAIFYRFKECIKEIDDEIIFEAIHLKLKNKNLSYADCIGYVYSLKNRLVFLTGDKEFKDMENVEFVK
ncbi:PIN domain-containing protein [Candidatus Woesearchaeota archaeon]|nr:PIN domain-containing protein [Candidatus Woesearchaeota archaeon]